MRVYGTTCALQLLHLNGVPMLDVNRIPYNLRSHRPCKGRITLLAPYRGEGCVGALIH